MWGSPPARQRARLKVCPGLACPHTCPPPPPNCLGTVFGGSTPRHRRGLHNLTGSPSAATLTPINSEHWGRDGGGVSAQPASGGGCLPQPRWAVCATGAGARQGQTSREGEKDIWWTAGTARGGTGHLGLTHTETQRGRLWTACGPRRVGSKNSQTTPATHKRHIPPHSAQPQHTNYGAPRTRKRHQQEHRPQRPTERSDPTQHAKGRTVTVQGPVKEQQPDGMSHRGGREHRVHSHKGSNKDACPGAQRGVHASAPLSHPRSPCAWTAPPGRPCAVPCPFTGGGGARPHAPCTRPPRPVRGPGARPRPPRRRSQDRGWAT